MLILQQQLTEQVVFECEHGRIVVKPYKRENDSHIYLAIDAPQAVAVVREKIAPYVRVREA